tara:strand:- start:1497 stop:2084 length:588 start_codon:yes stop_codon:yes gene_type:complete
MSYFFVGDLSILKDKRLSAIDRLVYFSLVSFMNGKTGECYPRYAKIKSDLGISRASINRAVHNLARHDLIKIKRLSSTNLYSLPQQSALQKNRIERLKSQFETTDVSQSNLLIKPSLYNHTRNRNYNSYQRKQYSPPVTANHSKSTIDYQGNNYKYCGQFGEYLEYVNDQGEKVQKHKWKAEPVKKFEATSKVAL